MEINVSTLAEKLVFCPYELPSKLTYVHYMYGVCMYQYSK